MLLFYLIVILGMYYFGVRERHFDVPALAFFSSLLYFLPGFLGVIKYHAGSGFGFIEDDITNEAYFVYNIVILFVIIGGIYNEFTMNGKKEKQIKNDSFILYKVLFPYAILIAVLFVITNLDEIIAPHKPVYNRFHVFYQILASIAFIYSIFLEKYKRAVFIFILLLIDVYAGNREGMAIPVVATAMLILMFRGKSSLLLANKKAVLISLFAGVFLMFYKTIYIYVLLGRGDLILDKLTDADFFLSVFKTSEPFTVQSTLHLVIVNNFEYKGNYFSNILYNLILFSSELGVRIEDVSFAFNDILFSTREAGVASNIWAEAYAVGGKLLVVCYAAIYSFFAVLYDSIIRKCKPFLKPFILTSGVYLFLFIHRTGLYFQATMQKRIILISVLIIISTYFIKKINYKYK